MLKFTKEEAREFLVNYHNINTSSKMTIDDVINRINIIQYDPLSVVGTNPELVLQSRVTGFKRSHLDKELYVKRSLIDGWDKQMCIYQSKYFSEYRTVRNYRSKEIIEGYKKYYDLDVLEFSEDVLNIVKDKGPILSSRIKLGESKKRTWGHSKPSTASLDYLFNEGTIGVHSRKHRQKRYDLNEKLIPYKNITPFDDDSAFIEWLLYRRVEALGIFSNRASVHNKGVLISKADTRKKYLKRLIDKGLVEELSIEGINEILYIPKHALGIEIKLLDRISFIAPLDNLIWDRNLLEKLFDFDYRWEVYTRASKRKYGYYVLPILRKDKFIGRIEFEQYKHHKLVIKSIFYESGIIQNKTLKKKLDSALNRFSNYLHE